MAEFSYLVVKFEDEKVAIVSERWFGSNGVDVDGRATGISCWPSRTSTVGPSAAARKHMQPSSTWTTHSVCVLAKTSE